MLENFLQILGFLGWFSFLLLDILFKAGGGWGDRFTCRKFAEMFGSFLFAEGVIGSILGGWCKFGRGEGWLSSKVCISTFSVAQSSARMHFCSAWSSVMCVPV